MISNGFFLQPELIQTLNEAGLQRMQLSIDGVQANETTQKVLSNLKRRLQWLRDHARFEVVISASIGRRLQRKLKKFVSFVRQLGFGARVLLVARQPGATQVEQRRLESVREHRGQSSQGAGRNSQRIAGSSCAVARHRSSVEPAAAIFTWMNTGK
jgi:MoaA/NifB/PqqE/SkfB family radical SAM enzyme